jgi:hypothetical protein
MNHHTIGWHRATWQVLSNRFESFYLWVVRLCDVRRPGDAGSSLYFSSIDKIWRGWVEGKSEAEYLRALIDTTLMNKDPPRVSTKVRG